MDYVDTAVGVYRDARLLRFVCGLSDAPARRFELQTIDVPITSICKVILRKRTTPAWSSPFPDDDGRYKNYDFYYQTRIYTPSTAPFAPAGAESRVRLIDARYVCDWVCEHTGLRAEVDAQESPLGGYPEGV
jgi:hypothetical protein